MQIMTYVDGMVAAVLTANRQPYIDYATTIAAMFKDQGALSVVDCWGDDVPQGVVTSFPLAVKATADETVVFTWITWPSRAVRDSAWNTLMADPRMQPGAMPPPFDGKRMIFGGFEVVQSV
jgi:uncharacterized protein YbaA (DUF1428 family)